MIAEVYPFTKPKRVCWTHWCYPDELPIVQAAGWEEWSREYVVSLGEVVVHIQHCGILARDGEVKSPPWPLGRGK